jgi:hypothetical protein
MPLIFEHARWLVSEDRSLCHLLGIVSEAQVNRAADLVLERDGVGEPAPQHGGTVNAVHTASGRSA